MPVKRRAARRVGITEYPATIDVTLPAASERDVRAIARAVKRWTPRGAGFAAQTSPVLALLRRVIEAHGGLRTDAGLDLSPPYTRVGDYIVPGDVEDASVLDYALRIVWWLERADAVSDRDDALGAAWIASSLYTEASFKFRWERLALQGEKNRASTRKAARMRGLALAEEARQHDALILKLVKRFELSDELQAQYRSARAYVRMKTDLSVDAIRRRFVALGVARHRR